MSGPVLLNPWVWDCLVRDLLCRCLSQQNTWYDALFYNLQSCECIHRQLFPYLAKSSHLKVPDCLGQQLLMTLMTSHWLAQHCTEASLTADWAITNCADCLGYKLLGWVTSLNSILPTPRLDHSTSLGGQTYSLLVPSGSLALQQAALWHHPPVRIELHCGMNCWGWKWTSSWTCGRCRGPHEGGGRVGTTHRHESQAGIIGFGPAVAGWLQWQWPCSFVLQPRQ